MAEINDLDIPLLKMFLYQIFQSGRSIIRTDCDFQHFSYLINDSVSIKTYVQKPLV
nr:Uncharacterised protein [Raoultella sp. NCTC 9187]